MRLTSDISSQRPGVLLLRFTVAGLMLFHGIAKLRNGLEGIESLLAGVGLPVWLSYGVLVGEVLAPLLVLAGLWVRPAALVMAFTMVVAVGLAHPTQLFTMGRSGGYGLELQAFFLFCSVAIALLVDRRRM
ncbi:MAG TPA: DoxX family protein [Burkholderiaceae bacterium]|nr:DoxX family protein [Burkholderiaceae bacterium]